MDLQGNMKDHFSEIKNSLIATGYVENAATSLHDALHVYSYGDGYYMAGQKPKHEITYSFKCCKLRIYSTMHMKLIEGRDFYAGN